MSKRVGSSPYSLFFPTPKVSDMQINGRKAGLNRDVLVLSRGESDFVFEAEALPDMDAYDVLCPAPVPPYKILPGGTKIASTEDADYQAELNRWADRKYDYLVI